MEKQKDEIIVLDIETAPIKFAEQYVTPKPAPDHYKKPEVIEAWNRSAKRKALDVAALDPDLCRIVALGTMDVSTGLVTAQIAKDANTEKELLRSFWQRLTRNATLLGYNVIQFDLPVMLRRSMYLQVDAPHLDLHKYRRSERVVDLMLDLSFSGSISYRSLGWYARRFDLPSHQSEASVDGAMIPSLVGEGDWEAVVRHVQDDVVMTAELAQRLDVIPQQRIRRDDVQNCLTC